MASLPIQQAPARPTETVEQRFRRLAAAWREVAPSHPRSPVRYDHPVYQEVISLGPAVVPCLLHALTEYPRDWFWALHIITGADPVTPEARGNFSGMKEAWLHWGGAQGYLPEDGAGVNGHDEG